MSGGWLAALRAVLVIVLVLLVQSTLGIDLRFVGLHPDLTWLLPVAAGLAGGPDEGAIVGFVAGLAVDVFLPTPFGLTALVGCVLGYAVGRFAQWVSASEGALPWPASVLVALAGSAVAVMLYAVLGALLGQEQMLKVDLLAAVLVVALVNAVLVVPVNRVMRWALAPPGSGGGARARSSSPSPRQTAPSRRRSPSPGSPW